MWFTYIQKQQQDIILLSATVIFPLPFLPFFSNPLIDIENVKEIARFLILSEKPPFITSFHT